jgi:hypothetical protein
MCAHFTFNREMQMHCQEAVSANAAIILPSCAWIMFTHARTHARAHARMHAWPVVCLPVHVVCLRLKKIACDVFWGGERTLLGGADPCS